MIRKEIGERIKTLREISGLSQEKFAEVCNLDRTYINSLENGRRNISIDTLAKICEALNISYAEFFEFNKVDFPFVNLKKTKRNVVNGRRIITLPCGNDLAYEHYLYTMVEGASVYVLPPFAREYAIGDKVYVWGQTDGKNKTNLRRFEVISPNDIAIFTKKGKIIAKATVLKIDINADLSIKLWGTLNGEPWKNMIYFDKPEELNIDIKDFNLAVGYKPNNIIQGFTTNIIAEEHPNLMKLLNIK